MIPVRTIMLSVAVGVVALPVLAQPTGAPPPSAEVTNKARELFDDGVKAFKRQEYGRAHAAFAASFALRPHPITAANLGECELYLFEYRTAAEHLSFALANTPRDDATYAQVQSMLTRAKKEVGTLRVTVDTSAAEVSVDGTVVGKAPLADAIFVKPGEHRLSAKLGDRSAVDQTVRVAAGETREVSLTIEAAPAATPAGSAGPAPSAGPILPGATHPVGPGDDAGPSPVLLWGGVALGGVLAAVGTGFLIASVSASSDVDDLQQPGGSSACAGVDTTGCQDLADAISRRDTFRGVGFAGLGLGVAVGAAAVVYGLTSSNTTATTTGRSVAPMILRDGGGVTAVGTW